MEQDLILHRLECFFADNASPFVEQTQPFTTMLARALALILSQGNDPASPAIVGRLNHVDWGVLPNGPSIMDEPDAMEAMDTMDRPNEPDSMDGASSMDETVSKDSSNVMAEPNVPDAMNAPNRPGVMGAMDTMDGLGVMGAEYPEESGQASATIAAQILDTPAFFQGLPKRALFSARRFLEAVAHETLDLEELSCCSEETILETLFALKGVGPDTAEAMVLYVFNKPFIPVNTGLYRVANRHGGVPESPEREEIRDWYRGFFPEETEHIRRAHAHVLAVARRFCKASTALCAGCPLKVML